MEILHYKDEPIYRETFPRKELKDFFARMGAYWDGEFETLMEHGSDPKYHEEWDVDLAATDFVIYNMEYTLKNPLTTFHPEYKITEFFKNNPKLKIVISKGGQFMLYTPDEKVVFDLSKYWMEERLTSKVEYESRKIFRDALLNKEREMGNEKLTKEQCIEINNRYTALLEASKQIVELSSNIRKDNCKNNLETEYLKILNKQNKR